MDHFAGLDVSVKDTSVCIVDGAGKIVREVKVASEPDALLRVLRTPAYHFKRIGLEAGPLSQWLFSALGEANLPVICVETRHMRAVLKAQINKTDRNDARGIAQMMRVGLYRPVHVKTLRSQKLRMLLTHRKLLQSKAIAIENDLRGTLRNFGLKVGIAGWTRFEARIEELVEDVPDLAVLIDPLLVVRRVLREQIAVLHRRLLTLVRDDEVCRRLMTIPGVGPVVALTYRATVDVPARFRKSNKQDVVAAFGRTDTVIIDCLTPELYRGGGDRHHWGLRAGHIPGAVNVPYLANIDAKLSAVTAAEREQLLASGRSFAFASATDLTALYENAGVASDKHVITYCGRGYAAACALLALKLLGNEKARLYDGGWAEWSADPNLPVEVSQDVSR